jgi:hypothetical protein
MWLPKPSRVNPNENADKHTGKNPEVSALTRKAVKTKRLPGHFAEPETHLATCVVNRVEGLAVGDGLARNTTPT